MYSLKKTLQLSAKELADLKSTNEFLIAKGSQKKLSQIQIKLTAQNILTDLSIEDAKLP